MKDLIADLNDFNDHAYTRFVETLKVRIILRPHDDWI